MGDNKKGMSERSKLLDRLWREGREMGYMRRELSERGFSTAGMRETLSNLRARDKVLRYRAQLDAKLKAKDAQRPE